MAQRISRAKATIKGAGARFEMPPDDERSERLHVVLHVLYLMFNEGYTASSGEDLQRPELAAEAIRITRDVRGRLPDDGEVAGLLALMLLTDARRPARTESDGSLVPLAEQDRSRWDLDAIREGVGIITATLPRGRIGPYQLQAAIAAIHDEAPRAEDTDWREILGLYQLLERVSPNPMVTLNHAVAAAMVDGPAAGLAHARSPGRRRADRQASSTRGGPSPPPRDGRRRRRRADRVQTGGAANDQRAGAALSRGARRQTRLTATRLGPDPGCGRPPR